MTTAMRPDTDAAALAHVRTALAFEGAARAHVLLERIGSGVTKPDDLASLMQLLHSGDLMHGACVVLHEALRKAAQRRARREPA